MRTRSLFENSEVSLEARFERRLWRIRAGHAFHWAVVFAGLASENPLVLGYGLLTLVAVLHQDLFDGKSAISRRRRIKQIYGV